MTEPNRDTATSPAIRRAIIREEERRAGQDRLDRENALVRLRRPGIETTDNVCWITCDCQLDAPVEDYEPMVLSLNAVEDTCPHCGAVFLAEPTMEVSILRNGEYLATV